MNADAGVLFDRNRPLMHYIVHRLAGPRPPEWLTDAALVGFENACLTYRSARGRFSTYAVVCIRNAVRSAHRRRAHDALAAALRLDQAVAEGGASFGDLLADPRRERELDDALTAVALTGTRVARQIALEQRTQTEIAAALGVSQARVSRIWRQEAARLVRSAP